MAGDYVRRHADEVAALLEDWSADEGAGMLERAPLASATPVFAALTPGLAAGVMDGLSDDRAAGLLRAIDPAQAAVVCSRLARGRLQRLLGELTRAEARELRELMAYPPNSAAALMTARVETFRPGTPAGRILERLRAARAEGVTEVALTGAGGQLAGVAAVAALAAAEPATPATELVHREHAAVNAMAPREELVRTMTRRGVAALAVVDTAGRLLGVVRQDRIARAIHEEATADVQTMVGASGDEQALSPVGFAVRKRLPWLQINLLTAFLASAVVGIFEETIARVTALAILLPIVAGQSGNTGSQALAVTIRGLALREVRLRHWRRVAAKEGAVGLINGLGVALTTAGGVYLWSRSPGLTAVIAVSMVLSMVVAGFAGAIIPMGLTAVRQDPAQSSSILLTTVTDIVGFFSFLGIATLLMNWL